MAQSLGERFVPSGAGRFQVLDGWRGLSILLVLAAHLLPLGPKSWRLNSTAGPLGMALFFTLSGFLITQFLLRHRSVLDFLIRRFFRIVPLAWVCIALTLPLEGAPAEAYLEHFLFYANLPPSELTPLSGHLWSLCVEMQFYVGMAVLVAALGTRGLLLLPLFCLAVTFLRIATGTEISIVTYLRVDEILAGGVLALVHDGKLGAGAHRFVERLNPYALLLLLLVSCHPATGFFNYARPYLTALTVGATLLRGTSWMARGLQSRRLAYVAAISYALYVAHPLLAHSWLGSGETMVKYAKRPLLVFVLLLVAHLSTFYFEKRWIAIGKRFSARWTGRADQPARQQAG